jgi:hypothetical protein
LPTRIAPTERRLIAEQYRRLSDVPPEAEWFDNISNAGTKRAYENAICDFIQFTGILWPEEFRTVMRAHVIAWRDDLARRELGGTMIQHRLAALAALFEYLCERNAVTYNPVSGIRCPKAESGERKTPAIGDHQARGLLAAPGAETVEEKRDHAILLTLLPAVSSETFSGSPARPLRAAQIGVQPRSLISVPQAQFKRDGCKK